MLKLAAVNMTCIRVVTLPVSTSIATQGVTNAQRPFQLSASLLIRQRGLRRCLIVALPAKKLIDKVENTRVTEDDKHQKGEVVIKQLLWLEQQTRG